MKYHVQFQEMPKRGGKPANIPGLSPVEIDAATLLPNLGDHVRLQPTGGAPLNGKVRTRLFTYLGADACRINIVIQHDDSDWTLLITE